MADREYRPRLSVEITPEQKRALDKTLVGRTHGLQRAVFSVIIDDLIRILNHPNSDKFLAAILQRQATLVEYLDIDMTEDDLS